MSADYLAATAGHLARCGFAVSVDQTNYGDEATAQRYHCVGLAMEWVLEVVSHPAAEDRFFLEIVRHHNLSSASFPLDSWRFFDDRIEFKYYADETSGMGLSLVFGLELSG